MLRVVFQGREQLLSAGTLGTELPCMSPPHTGHFPRPGLVKVPSGDQFGKLKPNTRRATRGALPRSPGDTGWDGVSKAGRAKHQHLGSHLGRAKIKFKTK